MINFRVRDIDKMAAQLREKGIAVEVDPEVYPNGRFASCPIRKATRSNSGTRWQGSGLEQRLNPYSARRTSSDRAVRARYAGAMLATQRNQGQHCPDPNQRQRI